MRKPKETVVKKKARNDTSYKGKGVEKKKKDLVKRKVSRVPKTRNGGTMTEASFFSMIRSALRKLSRYWKPITKAKMEARIPYVGPNTRQKFAYICNHCKGSFKESDVQIDHIEAVGSLRSVDDLPGFVERLFAEDGFQCLCSACHTIKTSLDREEMKQQKLTKDANTI